MKKTIGLAGPAGGFLQRLTEYIDNQGEVEVFLCTSEDRLEEEVEGRKPSVLFVMRGFMVSEALGIPVVEFAEVADREDTIYQYQSAHALYQEMGKYIWKESSRIVRTDGKKPIYAVYSPLGRSGKTSFACAYAKEHSFFYISMEEYGIITNSFCSEGRLFYHIKNRKKDILSLLIDHMEEKDGIPIFGAPLCYEDILCLDTEDFQWFLDELRGEDTISGVMIDFGSGCLFNLEILDLFDRLYIPTLPGEMEERKLRQFRELLYEINGKMEGKRKEISVPRLSWKSREFLRRVQNMDGLNHG